MKISNLIWFWLVIIYSLVACVNHAASQMPSALTVQSRVPTDKSYCGFDKRLKNDFSLFAAGAYSGRKLDFQIDSSGSKATQMDIVVNHTQKQVVLMLGAYEPTIWNISWTPDTKITAIILSGYHKQVTTGLTEATQVLISTNENNGECGFFYVDLNRLSAVNHTAQRLFKRKVDMVFLAERGQVVIGDTIPEDVKLTQSHKTKPEHYRKAELSGVPGLEQAVIRGELRKATLNDAHAWVDVISKEKPQNDIPPVAGQDVVKPRRPLLMNAYVVLKAFIYPGGLFGGDSAVFFIPRGVPLPTGKLGHSTIYDFNALSCVGSLCLNR